MSFYRLSDFIDAESIRKIAESNNILTGMTVNFVDAESSIISSSGSCEFCRAFSQNENEPLICESFENSIIKNMRKDDVHRFKCQYGINNIALPVFIAEKLAAIMFLGNFFESEYEKKQLIEDNSQKISDEVMRILGEVNVIPEEKIISIIDWNKTLLKFVSSSSVNAIYKRGYNKTLKNIENRYKNLAENTRDMVFRFNIPKGLFEYVNAASHKLTGYTPEEFYLDSSILKKSADPEDKKSLEFWKDIKGNIKDTYEYRIIHRNKSVKWVYQRNTLVNDTDGKPKAVEAILTDITELKVSESSMIESSFNYTDRDKSGCVGIWEYNFISREFFLSEKAGYIFGFNRDKNKKNIEDIKKLIVDKNIVRMIDDLIEEKKASDYEYEIITREGDTKIIKSQAEIIKDRNGNPFKLLCIIHDITRLIKSEKEKKSLEKQLIQAQKMESLGRLAGGVAHDFNNMLSIIIGNTEIMKFTMDESSKLHSNLNEIYKAAERSTSLTRQLLTFARKHSMEPEYININDVISDMFKMIQRLIGEDIEFVWIPSENIDIVKIDPSHVDQLIVNLCVNARDAIKDVGRVIIETRNVILDGNFKVANNKYSGSYIMISVSDNGSGIDDEIKANLFKPFYTTKEMGKGSGLGLSTVYGVVKQYNGFIEVESEQSKGTTFKIYLPSAEEEKNKKEEKSSNDAIKGGNENILVVEDEEPILNMIRKLLEDAGYNVLTASSPTMVFEIMKNLYKQKIDLLVTDVIMPKMNGKELSSKLSILRPDLKTLYMSGYTSNVIEHHGILEDGVQFINKPFSRQDFIKKVREILDSNEKR